MTQINLSFPSSPGPFALTLLGAPQSGGGGSSVWGGITGTLSDQTDLQSALDAKVSTAGFDAAVAATPAVAANTAKVTNATHSGDATGATVLTLATVNSNVGSFGLAGSVAQFVVNAKGLITSAVNVAISIAATAISDSTAAGRAMLTAATAAAQTALLDVFTSGAKGLAPASGGGSTNFLRADGTWAAPGGGGTPGGSSGEVQYNNAGAFAGAADVEIEGGQLRLPAIAAPTAPASGGVKVFGDGFGANARPAFQRPGGNGRLLQPELASGCTMWFLPVTGTTISSMGFASSTGGTATSVSFGSGSRRARLRRIEYLVTVAATNAIAFWRSNNGVWTVGGDSAWEGGFDFSAYWGPATGGTTSTHRGFCGMRFSPSFTDVEPSSLVSFVGMGWDAADTNIQFMHNDAAGTATKVDLGASFPVPSADRANTYRLEMSSPPGTTQSVDYKVTNLETGDVASGTVTTNLPTTTDFLQPVIQLSVGGTSSVIGIAVGQVFVQSEY